MRTDADEWSASSWALEVSFSFCCVSGIISERSLAFGASTPWKRIRLSLGRGTAIQVLDEVFSRQIPSPFGEMIAYGKDTLRFITTHYMYSPNGQTLYHHSGPLSAKQIRSTVSQHIANWKVTTHPVHKKALDRILGPGNLFFCVGVETIHHSLRQRTRGIYWDILPSAVEKALFVA